jgi:hypothetical protein
MSGAIRRLLFAQLRRARQLLSIVWFEVAGDELVMELEADVDDGTWVGLGVSDTGAMIGSDVTITGFLNGTPRATDYYLTAKSQCNYNSGANQRRLSRRGHFDVSECATNGARGTLDVALVGGRARRRCAARALSPQARHGRRV